MSGNIIDASDYFIRLINRQVEKGRFKIVKTEEHPLDELRYQGDEQATTSFEMNFNKEFFENVRKENTKPRKSQFELQQENKYKNLLQFPPLPERSK